MRPFRRLWSRWRPSTSAAPRPTTSSTSSTPEDENDPVATKLAKRADEPQNFTLRGIAFGVIVGVVIVFSNTYFGLQTGWISGMSMPSALLGFGFFKVLSPYLRMQFSPVENVLIQSVAGSVGTMPLGCGFVGVIPALEFLLKRGEQGTAYTFFFQGVESSGERIGGMSVSLPRLMLWAAGVCLFGVVFAVPLRREVIIREKLKFPSGTATALMIGVLHGQKGEAQLVKQEERAAPKARSSHDEDERQGLMAEQESDRSRDTTPGPESGGLPDTQKSGEADWRKNIRNMFTAFLFSAVYTIMTYFMPFLRNLPVFGRHLARKWLWTLNPSPAYVGQGIIMGPTTTAHMLFGAVIGWGILSPLAKSRGWAPGAVDDWESGSKGWIVWISLAIMLADALVSLGWLVARPLLGLIIRGLPNNFLQSPRNRGYAPISNRHKHRRSDVNASTEPEPEADAPPSHLVSTRTFLITLAASIVIYYVSVHVAFPSLLTFTHTTLSLFLALFLSLLGVRALGETDLNPVSGISKLTQLIFAAIVPASSTPNAIPVNLLAGAISESAALQAGDLLQDLKTGHLLGAAPAAQFWGQMIGSVIGAVLSAAVYRLYVGVYEIPGPQFQIPTAFVWVFTARLVTGQGLPPMAATYAIWAAVIWGLLTVVRMAGRGTRWVNYVPGGIAVAVGMYNTPSFTFARAVGGLGSWYWMRRRGGEETGIVVIASGLILGEGLVSIVNLGLASAGVPHLNDWS
ncbi:MAG: hypothetical protein Q9162_004489 [Coniocarpon cinnabarinum]